MPTQCALAPDGPSSLPIKVLASHRTSELRLQHRHPISTSISTSICQLSTTYHSTLAHIELSVFATDTLHDLSALGRACEANTTMERNQPAAAASLLGKSPSSPSLASDCDRDSTSTRDLLHVSFTSLRIPNHPVVNHRSKPHASVTRASNTAKHSPTVNPRQELCRMLTSYLTRPGGKDYR